MQGGETTAEPPPNVCLCISSDHAGGNVEDSVSSRLYGNLVSFAGRKAHREPFHIRKQGCELFHITARMLLTADNNVLGRMTISSAVTMKHVNLLNRLKMNRVVHAANICTGKQCLTDFFIGSSYSKNNTH